MLSVLSPFDTVYYSDRTAFWVLTTRPQDVVKGLLRGVKNLYYIFVTQFPMTVRFEWLDRTAETQVVYLPCDTVGLRDYDSGGKGGYLAGYWHREFVYIEKALLMGECPVMECF